MSNLLQYKMFFLKYGIRRKESLITPPTFQMEQLMLPRGSIYHHSPSTNTIAPDVTDPVLNDEYRYIFVDHVMELSREDGSPRHNVGNYISQIRNYHLTNRKMFWLKRPLATVTDPRTLIVESYQALNETYVYKSTPLSFIDKWNNETTTIFNRIKTLDTDRHHFMVLEMPATIPARTQFINAERKADLTTTKPFKSTSGLFLLDMWKWLGLNRDSSLLGKYDQVTLNRINLIVKFENHFSILNLGLLDTWRKDPKIEENDMPAFTPEQIQRGFLKMLLTLSKPEEVKLDKSASSAITNALMDIQQSRFDSSLLEEDVVTDPDIIPVDFTEIDNEIEAHDKLVEQLIEDVYQEPKTVFVDSSQIEPYVPTADSLITPIAEEAKRLAGVGSITIKEAERLVNLASGIENIPNPFGPGSLKDLATIDPELLKIKEHAPIKDSPTVFDKTMLKSTLIDFDPLYIKNVMLKDITAFCLNIQKAGVIITDFKVTEVEDVMNHSRIFTMQLQPVAGKPTTVKFEIPVVGDTGVMLVGGVKYVLRKQHGDMPIRKTTPSRVALTSYYGKVFVERSEYSSLNYGKWLTNNIESIGADLEDSRITNIRPANAFNHRIVLPRTYTELSKRFKSFTVNTTSPEYSKIDFYLDYKSRIEEFGEEAVRSVENNSVVVGKVNNQLLTIDHDNQLTTIDAQGIKKVLPSLEELIDLPVENAPVETAVMSIFGKSIPLGLILSYKLGLTKLIKTLNVPVRIVEAGKALHLTKHEFRVRFKDVNYIFSKEDKIASMLFSGFNIFKKALVNYKSTEFDKKPIYINVLESSGLHSRYIREIDLIFDMFIDHITKELLIDMKEPTDMVGLLLRATSLLLVDYYPDDGDKNFVREKGYERIAGVVYHELVNAVRVKRSNPVVGRSSIDVNPKAVKMAIVTDSSKEILDEINPVHNLKQKEVVTYGGTGGRSTKTMVKSTRAYHETDMGVISEATVDSGNVGIISYLSADPNLETLRGVTRRYKESDGLSSLLSTSALLAPASDTDDPKRTNFVNIQNSHTISAKGYRSTPLMTGYENVIAHRTDDIFAYTAKQDGKVIGKTDKTVSIEYVDGSIKHIEIGRRFGKSSGSIYPHDVVSDLKEGDVFKFGDTICYNTGFFEKDFFNNNSLSWKAGIMVNTALMDTADTFEDSSAISEEISKLLSTETTYLRQIVVNFDQSIRSLVNEGQAVDVDSILCTIEDSVTAKSDLFDDKTLDSLRMLSGSNPVAKHKGVIDKVEVFYNGEVQNMSESLEYLAQIHDRQLSRLQKNLGKAKVTGKVDGGYRIEGNPLGKNQLVVNIYITAMVGAGVGDKGVFANQMKTIFGRVFTGVNKTESGLPVDAKFAYQSISNRIVRSPEIIMTTNTLLKVIGQRAAAIFKGK